MADDTANADNSTPAPDAWGSVPSEERQRELEDLFTRQQQWVASTPEPRDVKQSVFKDISLTGADVFWLAARSLATAPDAEPVAAQIERLRQAQTNLLLQFTLHLDALHLEGADLRDAHLERATLGGAHLERATLGGAHLERADLYGAHLEGANLRAAHLEGADLRDAHLEWAALGAAHLEGTYLSEAHLERADLREATLGGATKLNDAVLGDSKQGVSVADVRWGGVNLAVAKEWPVGMILGDERAAWALEPPKREPAEPASEDEKLSRKERAEALHEQEQAWRQKLARTEDERLDRFHAAVRANRQLATALRDQGMNEEADRFAYRAQVCQRRVFQLTHQRSRAALARFLDLIAGYGYKPERSLIAYLLAIFGFALAYYVLAQTVGMGQAGVAPFSPVGAWVFSMTSFHGRGFFPGGLTLDDPVTVFAALEAFCGLIIEVSFIATFSQRFFGK